MQFSPTYWMIYYNSIMSTENHNSKDFFYALATNVCNTSVKTCGFGIQIAWHAKLLFGALQINNNTIIIIKSCQWIGRLYCLIHPKKKFRGSFKEKKHHQNSNLSLWMQRLTGNAKGYGNSSKYDIRLTNIELNTSAMYYFFLFFPIEWHTNTCWKQPQPECQ